MNNEQVVRRAYEVAEKVDLQAFVDCFTPDGTFTDMSINVTYRGAEGPLGLGATVANYAKGTHKGPLKMGDGVIPATGKRMDTPCFDVFRLVKGKIASFHCYPSGTVVLTQLGVLGNLEAAIVRGG